MGAKSDHFCPFSAYFGVFSPDLLMECQIFISIVDISANLKNIDIDIDKTPIIDLGPILFKFCSDPQQIIMVLMMLMKILMMMMMIQMKPLKGP